MQMQHVKRHTVPNDPPPSVLCTLVKMVTILDDPLKLILFARLRFRFGAKPGKVKAIDLTLINSYMCNTKICLIISSN